MEKCLVFCRTNLDCTNLESFFSAVDKLVPSQSFSCRVLAGTRSVDQRRIALQDFKAGKVSSAGFYVLFFPARVYCLLSFCRYPSRLDRSL
jgi:hypothetical protein